MIIGGSICGFVAAAIDLFLWNPTYSSTAVFLVAKIKQLDQPQPDRNGQRDRDIEMVNANDPMVAEQEMMNSLDSLKKVAENVGPAKIMATTSAGPICLDQAAGDDSSEFVCGVRPRYSPILRSLSRSRSPEIITNVLGQVIARVHG